jgi:hypothetical protein
VAVPHDPTNYFERTHHANRTDNGTEHRRLSFEGLMSSPKIDVHSANKSALPPREDT